MKKGMNVPPVLDSDYVVKIIPIGRCCRVSFDLEKLGLKDKSGVFEWVWTDTLTEVNFVIRKILRREEIQIHRNQDGQDVINGTNIVSRHYTNVDYESILARRAARFLRDLHYTGPVIFVRDDFAGTIKHDELVEFKRLIYEANPRLDFRVLLLSERRDFKAKIDSWPVVNGVPFVGERIVHRVYNFDAYLEYLEDCLPDLGETLC